MRRVLALVVAALLLLASCGDRETGAPPAAARGGWQEVAPVPLTPRWGAVAVWTGREAIVWGGVTTPACPPNADCVSADVEARDGASYDPGSRTWSPVAAAPVPLAYHARTAVVGDTVVVLARGRWWAYDVGPDRWRRLPDPPVPAVDTGHLAVLGDQVHVTGRRGAVLALEPVEGRWAVLPAPPTRLRWPSLVEAGDRLVLSGARAGSPTSGDVPAFTEVETWDGRSWSAPVGTRQVGQDWHWTGERLVDPSPDRATGLTGTPPYGGALDLTTGSWSPVPSRRDRTGGWAPVAAEGPLVVSWGGLYDDRTRTWADLGRPAGTSVDVDQAAVWIGGRLLVVGGLDEATGYRDPSGLSRQAWLFTPH